MMMMMRCGRKSTRQLANLLLMLSPLVLMLLAIIILVSRRRLDEEEFFGGVRLFGANEKVDYGSFSEGMRLQRAFGIPKYRLWDTSEDKISSRGELDYERIWDFMPSYSRVVWDAARPNLPLLTMPIANGEEYKYFIKFADPMTECHSITMGIGGVVESEKPFQDNYPQCYFLGVDPDEQRNRAVFESLGERARFVPAAVHRHSGERKGYFYRDGRYKAEELKHTGIDKLLSENFNATMIDILDLDVEGAEYSLLGWILQMRQREPIICQLNIEFHHPFEEVEFDSATYNYSIFFAELEQLLQSHAMLNTGKHKLNRNFFAHFVNVAEPRCLGKLLRPPT